MRAAKAVRRAKLVKSGSFSLCVGAADCADGAMLWGCVCGGAFDASEGSEKASALGQGVGEVRA